MYKHALLFAFLYIPLFGFGQSQFTINGRVKELKDGDKVYLSYRSNGILIKDSTIANNSSFSFRGNVNSPYLGFISARENPFGDIEILHNSLNLYIESGEIKVIGNDSLKTSQVFGTPSNIDFSKLNSMLAPYKNQQMQDDKSAYETFLSKTEPIKLSFIAANPDSYVSLATLKDMLNKAPISKVALAYQGLSTSLRNLPEGNLLGEKIAAASKSGIGKMAPDFTLPDVIGKKVKLSQFKGQYVLVDFWASWCLPCREENPNLKLAHKKFKGKPLSILSISIDDQQSKKAWINAIKKDDLTWTQLHDATKNVHNAYGVSFIPANFLIDPKGKIIAVNLKDVALIDKLQSLFKGNY